MRVGSQILSTELIELIIFHACDRVWDVNHLACTVHLNPHLATVSKKWCTIVESYTFSTIRLTASRLEDVNEIIRGHRRALLRHIKLDVVLPSYGPELYGKRERGETSINNQLLMDTFHALCVALSQWSLAEVAVHGMKLSLQVYSPSDVSRLPSTEAAVRRANFGPKEMLDHRFGVLHFAEPVQEFPTVNVITDLTLIPGSSRQLWPACYSEIASRFPRLIFMSAQIKDGPEMDTAQRIYNRHKFGESISTWPSSISSLVLEYTPRTRTDQNWPPGFILQTNRPDEEDLVSTNLRIFSRRLKTLTLTGLTIGNNLFWPRDTSKDSIPKESDHPFWPCLTNFTLTYQPVTVSDEWLFDLAPGEIIPDVEPSQEFARYGYTYGHLATAPQYAVVRRFRSKAVERLMNPFYLAAGRAARNMPLLNRMELQPILGWKRHEFLYEVTKGQAVASWKGNPLFCPAPEVLDAWEEVARSHTQKKLEVRVELLPESWL